MLSFICFSVSLFCWAHNEKHSFRMIIDAHKSMYIYYPPFDSIIVHRTDMHIYVMKQLRHGNVRRLRVEPSLLWCFPPPP